MDASETWSRRRFLGRTADVALLSALAGALQPLATLAAEGSADATLYDPRFPAARTLALELAGHGRVLATDGDATALVLSTLGGALQLSGTGQILTGGGAAKLRFNGQASAAPGSEAALSNLLNLIGRRQGALSLITIG